MPRVIIRFDQKSVKAAGGELHVDHAVGGDRVEISWDAEPLFMGPIYQHLHSQLPEEDAGYVGAAMERAAQTIAVAQMMNAIRVK